MNASLWDSAEAAYPRAECGCGRPVWRHWYPQRHGACGSVHGLPEIAAEYARLVAEAAYRALAVDHDLHVTVADDVKYSFGFTGFTGLRFNNATIVRSRFMPGSVSNITVDASALWVPGVDKSLAGSREPDTSWGWDRDGLRAYFAPRIVDPKVAKPRRPSWIDFDASYGIVGTSNVWSELYELTAVFPGADSRQLVRPVHRMPEWLRA